MSCWPRCRCRIRSVSMAHCSRRCSPAPLCVSSSDSRPTPSAMDGYLGAPEETRAVFTEGWFRTGDLATIDRGGWVRITGRKRERILRGGHSVFPPEVESVLLTHPDVAEAAVVGVPHAE